MDLYRKFWICLEELACYIDLRLSVVPVAESRRTERICVVVRERKISSGSSANISNMQFASSCIVADTLFSVMPSRLSPPSYMVEVQHDMSFMCLLCITSRVGLAGVNTTLP